MDFFDLANKRRSIRKFTDEEVPEEVIEKSLKTALLAANSSNLQPWEFYWIKDENKKEELIKACFSQNAAKTAKELVVAVSRIDTWKRNKNLLINHYKEKDKLIPLVEKYYNTLVPLQYYYDPFGISTIIRKIILFFFSFIGFFKPIARGPSNKHELFEIVTKTTALACQNIMMSLVAQGYDSCPMEGFDKTRVKKLLNLNNKSHIVMVLGIGKRDPKGIYGDRFRINEDLVIKIVD
tara:strand:+ start:5573 stop:6283 length:711 start_codon:yes stop_codon:yes gene_type:complete